MSTQFYVTFSSPKFNGNPFILNWQLVVTTPGRYFTRWHRYYNPDAGPQHTWKMLIVQPFRIQILSTCMSEKLPTEYTQGRIKLFGAPRQWKNFRPLFQAVFLSKGGYYPPPQTEWNATPPSPKTEITNILFYILNLWLRIYCSGLRGCDTREKEIVIWPCWCFMSDIIFTLLSLLLCLITKENQMQIPI